jgi:methyl-accepting chemotaxis protein
MTQTPDGELTLEGVADDLDTVKHVMMTLARQYERIDRTLDRTATQQEINTQAIAQINQAIAQLAATSSQQWQVIQEMQAEVRGLQVENRRILRLVLGTDEE